MEKLPSQIEQGCEGILEKSLPGKEKESEEVIIKDFLFDGSTIEKPEDIIEKVAGKILDVLYSEKVDAYVVLCELPDEVDQPKPEVPKPQPPKVTYQIIETPQANFASRKLSPRPRPKPVSKPPNPIKKMFAYHPKRKIKII